MSAVRTRLASFAALAGVLAATVATVCWISGADTAFASARPSSAVVVRPGDGTGEVVVAYRSGELDAVKHAVAADGGAIRKTYGKPSIVVVSPGPRGARDLIDRLSARPDVRYAEEARVISASWVPNDPEYASQWNLRRIGAEEAWDVERGESTMVVGIVDSGVDLEHPDLAGRIDVAHDYDYVSGDYVADDVFGHGTHVAGIIGAATDNALRVAGLANGCTILPVRVLDQNGNGDTTKMALGIIYAVDHGAKVINISAGGPLGTRTLEDAVVYATSRGSIVVAAAGNSGASHLDYPAAYSEVVAVGAVDQNAERWSYSSYGTGLDLMAPGITTWTPADPLNALGILSLTTGSGSNADGVSGRMYGTSMAAPHVSASIALLRSANPTWTASMIMARLFATAEDIGAAGKDARTGYGLVRADLALGAGTPPDSTVLDDSAPGRPLTDASVSGFIDVAFDPEDVYAVALREGQRFTASLSGPSAAVTRLEVLGPDASSLASPPIASVASTGRAAPITLEMTRSGTYSLRVSALTSGGTYDLTWARGYDTETLVEAPDTCAWGGSASVHGTVNSYGEEGVGLVPVILDSWPAGSTTWRAGVARTTTSVFGGYSFRVRPSRRTKYRVRFSGSFGEYASCSATVSVWPRAALSSPKPTTTVAANRTFVAVGTLRPEHHTGSKTVRIKALHKESGVWVLRESVSATNQDRSGYTRYVGKVRLTRRGEWKLLAYVGSDAIHAATYSAPRYLTVH